MITSNQVGSMSFMYVLPSESTSTPSGCRIYISDVSSCGNFLTNVKLDREGKDNATFM
jgi:hypothetical protein